eukprot:RCo003111
MVSPPAMSFLGTLWRRSGGRLPTLGPIIGWLQPSSGLLGVRWISSNALSTLELLEKAAYRSERRQAMKLLKEARPVLRSYAKAAKTSDSPDSSAVPAQRLTDVMNKLLALCQTKEAISSLFMDLVKDGVKPNQRSYALVMGALLKGSPKWDDLKVVQKLRDRMLSEGFTDNRETVLGQLHLASLQTSTRAQQYVTLWTQVRDNGIALQDADYAYFFDVPPTSDFEGHIADVVSTMRSRGVDPAVADQLRQKWTSLKEKFENDNHS